MRKENKNNTLETHCNVSLRKKNRNDSNRSLRGFTLVELIVVITILAILATIAFLSFQNISSTARDSSRLSDIRNVKSVLELSQIDSANYPLPDGPTQIVWSGATAWTQGTMGDTAVQQLKKFSKKPIDPLTNTAYTYSVTNSQKEYQIGYALENNLAMNSNSVLATTPPVFAVAQTSPSMRGTEGELQNQSWINKTNADKSSLLGYIDGNYNGVMIKVNTGSTDYYLGVPSIVSSDITKTNLVNQTGSLVFNGKKCLASSYTGTISNTNCLVFNPNTNGNFIIYSTGAGKTPDTTDFLTKLKNTYTGSVLNTISDINLTNRINGISSVNSLVAVLSKVGTSVSNVIIDNTTPAIVAGTIGTVSTGSYTYTTKVMSMKRSDNTTYTATWTTQNMRHPVNSCLTTTWSRTDTGKCSVGGGSDNIGYDDTTNETNLYGLYYQWSVASVACSSLGTGWKLATDEEFKDLERGLGCSDPSPTGTWNRCGNGFGGFTSGTYGLGYTASSTESVRYMGGVFGTNSTSLPGDRYTDGAFDNRGASGLWWSATGDAANASNRVLVSSNSSVNLFSINVAFGFSVVCLKN